MEVRDTEALARRLSGTRFAAAFARSAAREWLERTDAVVAFDAVLSEVERISGVSPGRGSAFDLIGAEAAVGWYPPAGEGGARRALGRRRAPERARLGGGDRDAVQPDGRAGGGERRARGDRRTACCTPFPRAAAQSLHLFLAGRVLVGGTDRSLVVKAARAAGEASGGVAREPALQAIRAALPARGELFAWLRDRGSIPGVWPARDAGRGSAGVRLFAGTTVEIDLVSEPGSPRPATGTAGSATAAAAGNRPARASSRCSC